MTRAVLALAALACVAGCGDNPPQIVDYSPVRGMTDVATSAPIRISFDRDVDKASVEGRLHTEPPSTGHIVWLSSRRLSYEHAPLVTSTLYQAILEPGYRATSGDVYQLRHHWQFTTEGPPGMSGSVPSSGEHGVDPAAFVTLDFTREMDQASLPGATSIVPASPFIVRLDPTDRRRAIVSPTSLLTPGATYTVSITTKALDIDGNHLDHPQAITFSTGAVRPLHHWVAFVAGNLAGDSGLWMVDELRFPRRLFNDTPIDSFSWSPDGGRLMLRGIDGGWTVLEVGGSATPLNLSGGWAATLAPGLGYAYIDTSGTLRRRGANGIDEEVAGGVTEAAVGPAGDRIAFVVPTALTTELWGYDIGLHAAYRLGSEVGSPSSLAWAPNGNRIAYLMSDSAGRHLRVLTLGNTSTKTTLATGDIGPPAWLPDSGHLVFSARVETPTGPIRKAFLISTASPPAALSLSLGLPAANNLDVVDPVPSPDGHQIAFVNQSGDTSQVWLMNADGTEPAPLTRFDVIEFPYSTASPAWTRS